MEMTERFTIDYIAEFILDTQDIDEYGGETLYDTTEDRIDDLCTLLNNLHDEVTDLNKANKMLKLQTYCQDQYIKKLELEQKALLEQLETQNI